MQIWREECSCAHRQVDGQPSKRPKKNGDKSAVAPKSSSILRKISNILKPIQCFRFTKAVLRHGNVRDQNPSLGMICPGDPHQRNPNAPKLEDRSQEETEWQERCAREAAWRLAKNILKIYGETETASFSSSENWCLPAPSTNQRKENLL